MYRRTKIMATLGPATDSPSVLRKMLESGLDMVRVNFSHGDELVHAERVVKLRKMAADLGVEVGVLADLQGAKVRVGRFVSGEVNLLVGDAFALDLNCDPEGGDNQRVWVDYKQLPSEVAVGDLLLLSDGMIQLRVNKLSSTCIYTQVAVGGVLSDGKGVNLFGGGLSAPALTQKDKNDLKQALSMQVNYIAISFVKSAEDIHYARKLVNQGEHKACLVAKIERAEAVEKIDAIITAADAVMVARGDLSVEIGDAQVPVVQKHIIKRAREYSKPVIVATQMMESMIVSPVATRAEISDVANAVLDGADAVMLSAETAVGAHPGIVVETVDRVCRAVEKDPKMLVSSYHDTQRFERLDEAVAMAAMYTANRFNVRAIIALTESGSTALWMSRVRSGIPIYAVSRSRHTCGLVALYRDVYPVQFEFSKIASNKLIAAVAQNLYERDYIGYGDAVLVTQGDMVGVTGKSNTLKIMYVSDLINVKKQPETALDTSQENI